MTRKTKQSIQCVAVACISVGVAVAFSRVDFIPDRVITAFNIIAGLAVLGFCVVQSIPEDR